MFPISYRRGYRRGALIHEVWRVLDYCMSKLVGGDAVAVK